MKINKDKLLGKCYTCYLGRFKKDSMLGDCCLDKKNIKQVLYLSSCSKYRRQPPVIRFIAAAVDVEQC